MDECESVPHELTAYLTTPPLLSKPLLGKVMLLYLAVSEHAVSAVLIREEGSKQIPIYYVSKALLDPLQLSREAGRSPDSRRS